MFIVLANVTSAVLVGLPMVTLVKLLPKVQPEVENALVKPEPTDSISKVAGPSMDELDEVGALLEITKPPPDMAVLPVYVPPPVRVKVLVPNLLTPPAPLMLPA
jgi:hypothetical protein